MDDADRLVGEALARERESLVRQEVDLRVKLVTEPSQAPRWSKGLDTLTEQRSRVEGDPLYQEYRKEEASLAERQASDEALRVATAEASAADERLRAAAEQSALARATEELTAARQALEAVAAQERA